MFCTFQSTKNLVVTCPVTYNQNQDWLYKLLVITKMLMSKIKNLFLQGFRESWNHWTAVKVAQYCLWEYKSRNIWSISQRNKRKYPVYFTLFPALSFESTNFAESWKGKNKLINISSSSSSSSSSPLTKSKIFKSSPLWLDYAEDRFQSRGQQLCKLLGIKESFNMRKEFNSHRIFFWYTSMATQIHCFVHKYGHRDVMWKRSIALSHAHCVVCIVFDKHCRPFLVK